MRVLIDLIGSLIGPEYRRFCRLLADPKSAQQRVQAQIVRKLKECEYGHYLGINSVDEWDRIPVVDYDDLKPWIDCQRDSGNAVLTPDPILFLERTSGSQGAIKWIPYTYDLRKSFHHLFCIWAYDLIRNGPRFRSGRTYMSITPAFGAATGSTEGLQDDGDYLDGWLHWILSPFLVTLAGAKRIKDMESFKHQLSLRLLKEKSLESISIWSPTFLLVHLDYIQRNREGLLTELGTRISSKRKYALSHDPISWRDIWPHLQLISCWDQAHATEPASALRRSFPEIMIQGKGLLATEAPMTLPLIQAQGYVPLIDEVFFEFEDDRGHILPLTQISEKTTYSLIISQKGGLYRYRMRDRVCVSSIYQNTPCLQFIGRDSEISDLVGEKLHAHFVREQFSTIPCTDNQFRCLVPCLFPSPHYHLIVDRDCRDLESMALHLDQALQTSPHYQLARQLGQLGPIRVVVDPQIVEVLTMGQLRSGCHWGDVKLPTLWTSPCVLSDRHTQNSLPTV